MRERDDQRRGFRPDDVRQQGRDYSGWYGRGTGRREQDLDRDYGGSGPTDAVPRGGYQRRDQEGRRYFDPTARLDDDQTGQRGMPADMAEEIAAPFDEDRIIARVDQDHRGRGPKGWRRSDARLAEEINDRLLDNPDVDASDLDVVVKDAEVLLIGTVPTPVQRRRAENLAQDIRGIRHVDNRLRVAGGEGPDRNSPGQGGSATLPTGASEDSSTTLASGVTGMAAGTGTSGGGDPLLGAEETRGRRTAHAPLDRGG
jgi:osmotically-inducible protein OsmY